MGFAGPVGLQGVKVVADLEVPQVADGVTGANKADTHWIHVQYGRDYEADVVADVRVTVVGRRVPHCGGRLEAARGIEVGHVFKLGTKYSEALGATYLDETGTERPMIMGCYGIGINRTMAAVIEQNHDERGISWPVSIAPYHVDLIVINPADAPQREAAEALYEELWQTGIETVLDDRDERAGVKFNDADLIGFPFRVVVGPEILGPGKRRDQGASQRRAARPRRRGGHRVFARADRPGTGAWGGSC